MGAFGRLTFRKATNRNLFLQEPILPIFDVSLSSPALIEAGNSGFRSDNRAQTRLNVRYGSLFTQLK